MRTIAAIALLLASAPAAALDHGPLDTILRARVRGGLVDYAAIKKNDRARLDAYVTAVGKARVPKGRAAALAFYLNAYNALVIKAVVDRYPLSSVMKVPGFFDKRRHRVAGRRVTLNDIENKIVRPHFKDARVHFALVCGARSCPPIQPRAFRAKGLDATLERLARRFIAGRGARWRGETLRLSMLFKWYAGDFIAAAGSVKKYIARYRKKDAARVLAAKKVAYMPYSWKLNDLRR